MKREECSPGKGEACARDMGCQQNLTRGIHFTNPLTHTHLHWDSFLTALQGLLPWPGYCHRPRPPGNTPTEPVGPSRRTPSLLRLKVTPSSHSGSELSSLWWWPLGPPSLATNICSCRGAKISSHPSDPTLQKLRYQAGSPGRGPPPAPRKQTSAPPAPILATLAASPGWSGLPAGRHTWSSVTLLV